MSDQAEELLDRVMAEAATGGLVDRSMRDLAAAVGSSHRMLNYHFGSRAGLLKAVVQRVEAGQRGVMAAMAATADSPQELARDLWDQVAAPELRGQVALFFEVLAAAAQGRPGTEGFLDTITEPWLEEGLANAEQLGLGSDAVDLRLAVAVVRGLLIDVLAEGDPAAATAAMERFIDGYVR